MPEEQKYKAIMTPYGKSVAINAYNSGEKVQIKYLGIGDGDGEEYIPDPEQTDLIHQVLPDFEVAQPFIDELNPAWLVTEGFIREDIGGFWIREIAIKSDEEETDENGNVKTDENGNILHKTIAIASWPPTYKPTLPEGGSIAAVIRVILEVSDTAVFNLNIDSTVPLVTRDEFDRHIQKTTDVHGSAVTAKPNSIAERDSGGRLEVAKPISNNQAARLQEINDVLNSMGHITDSGIPLVQKYTGDGVTTSFGMTGLLSDNADALMVTLDGIVQNGGVSYTIQMGAMPLIIFSVPPPNGVDIRLVTMVTLTQIPQATTAMPGIVKLANNPTECENIGGFSNIVVPVDFLRFIFEKTLDYWTAGKIDYSFTNRIVYGNNIFIVVGGNISVGGGKNIRSIDGGLTWTATESISLDSPNSIAYGNDIFIAINNNQFSRSTNGGLTWTSGNLPNNLGEAYINIAYGNGVFVVVGENQFSRSTDGGLTWTSGNLPNYSGGNIAYGNGVFMTVAGDGYFSRLENKFDFLLL
jgi:hypothetical protein